MTQVPPVTRMQWPLAALLLVAALVLGGGQGTLGDSVCQGLALALLACTLWRHGHEAHARLPRLAWLAALPLALPLLQLLPVPDAMWQSAPAREALASQLGSVGLENPSRISLDPTGTERSLLWMLPAVALFLAGLQLRAVQRYRLVALFVAVALMGLLLGISQLAGGVASPLRFYEISNYANAVGFFANSNHHASLMAMALPLVLVGTAAWVASQDDSEARARALRWALGGAVAVLVMLGIALARSRAGMGLGLLGLVLSVPAVLALSRGRGARRALVVAVVLGGALIVQFAMFGIVQRFEEGVVDGNRAHYAAQTRELASDYAPLGTGLGGFRRAFEAFDRESPISGVYINHAHNEPAELMLEAGWLLWVVLLPLLAAFAFAGWRAWRANGSTPAMRGLRRAAWISLLLVLLHSLVDYPLRTSAHLALFGLLAAFLVPGPTRRPSTTAPDAAQPEALHAS